MLAYDFRWEIIFDNRSELFTGLILTLQITAVAFAIAAAVGLPVAMMRMSASPLLWRPASLWIAVMRGIPLIVVLYWVYFAAASRGWFTLSEFRSGAVTLGLTGSGYMAENYRAALQSVDPGQRHAATAVGLGPGQAFRFVIAPQAARIVVPSAVNLLVALLKGATIVSIIGLADMFYVARTISFETFSPFELYSAAAVLIIAVTLVVAGLVGLLERRLSPRVPMMLGAEGLDFGPVWDQRGLLLGGLGIMAQVAVVSFGLSIVGGLVLARLRRSAAVWVRAVGFVLVQVLRGIALYVLVLWLFNGLAVASGIKLSAMQTGIVALSLLNSAYLSEVFRAGFGALPVGQTEAALAVGLTQAQARRAVLTPQMIRVTFPAMGNVLVDIVKDTAILSVVGVSELTRETQRWAQFYFRPFEFYTVAGILYFLVVLIVSGAWGRLERRLRRHTDSHTSVPTPRRWRTALAPSRLPATRLPS